MSTKFVCDICDYETDNPTELEGVKRTYKDGTTPTLKFDICPKCATSLIIIVTKVVLLKDAIVNWFPRLLLSLEWGKN